MDIFIATPVVTNSRETTDRLLAASYLGNKVPGHVSNFMGAAWPSY